MRAINRTLLTALVTSLVLSTTSARAGSVYQFAFDQSSYAVAPSASLLVNVYLQEQISGGSTSVLATDGLIAAGVRISFDLSPLPSDPASVLRMSDVLPNDLTGGFDGLQNAKLDSGSNVELSEIVDISSAAVAANDLGGGLFQILLGTFRFTAGSVAGQTTLIQVTDISGLSDTYTGGGLELDGLISAGNSKIQVQGAAVPEPASVISMALGVIGIAGYAISKSRKSAP